MNITLKNTFANIIVAPHLGGAILSYHVNINGKLIPVLRSSESATSVSDACSFPLVPYSNRIKHGTFFWQDRTYTLPLNHLPEKHSIHGHGWQTNWQVKEQSKTHLVIEYQYNTADWPSSYLATQTFTLVDAALHTELTLKNTGSEDMPAGLGFHPYFSRTQKARLQCSVDKMWQTDSECLPTDLVTAPIALSSPRGLEINQDSFDNVFTGFNDDAHIYWPEWQAKAIIKTSEHCKFLVLYNPDDQDFFCVEPVTHSTDAINMANNGISNTGMTSLQPDQSLHISMSIHPESHQFN